MSAVNKIEPHELNLFLEQISGWQRHQSREALVKTYRFKDFSEAMAFMVQAAMICEKMDHHPEWMNVYNRVDVALTTHSCHGISTLDIKLAKAMDALVAQ